MTIGKIRHSFLARFKLSFIMDHSRLCSIRVASIDAVVELPGWYRLMSGIGRQYSAWNEAILMAE